jgi:Sugar-transfer associated ATP-grasp
VVQPRLENNRALADISNGALATARVFTIRNELGQYEATNAAFRMAIGKNNVVDNFHQGGLATAVDLKTGQIGLATDMGIRPDVGWRDTHPVSGIRFAGRILPDWSEAVALACAAHAAFPQHVIVGWDVAMLEDGPCIIEGNAKPDLDIHQRVERRPLGDQRIATLIALNVKQAFAAADR